MVQQAQRDQILFDITATGPPVDDVVDIQSTTTAAVPQPIQTAAIAPVLDFIVDRRLFYAAGLRSGEKLRHGGCILSTG